MWTQLSGLVSVPAVRVQLVSVPAVRVFVGSALTISFGIASRDYTFDGVLLWTFSKRLGLGCSLRLGFGLGFRFKD